MAVNLDFVRVAEILVQDQNGDNTYSNDKALYGYIEAAKYLQVPAEIHAMLVALPQHTNENLGTVNAIQGFVGEAAMTYRTTTPYKRLGTMTALQFHKMSLLNYVTLKEAGLDDQGAYLAAALRTRWMLLGCLTPTVQDRGVLIDETVVNPMTEGAAALIGGATDIQELSQLVGIDIAGYSRAAMDPNVGSKFVVMWAETVWSISEYLFRVRGHHYKDEFKDLIKRMMRASTEGKVDLSDAFPFAAVFHTAIHPFGIKALPIMTMHFIAYGKIANAMCIRVSGAPNGTAAITTTAAALKSIAGEAWYSRFHAIAGPQIENIQKYAAAIMNNKYGFHLAAGLYGVTPARSITVDGIAKTLAVIDQEIGALAPVLQGFINFNKEIAAADQSMTYSFQNAKALEKRAASNPLLAARVQQMIQFTVDAISGSKTVADAISSTFPHLQEPAPANTAPV